MEGTFAACPGCKIKGSEAFGRSRARETVSCSSSVSHPPCAPGSHFEGFFVVFIIDAQALTPHSAKYILVVPLHSPTQISEPSSIEFPFQHVGRTTSTGGRRSHGIVIGDVVAHQSNVCRRRCDFEALQLCDLCAEELPAPRCAVGGRRQGSTG